MPDPTNTEPDVSFTRPLSTWRALVHAAWGEDHDPERFDDLIRDIADELDRVEAHVA